MREVTMPEIKTTISGEEVVIEGGWKAPVMEVEPRSEKEMRPYLRYYQRQGLRPEAARIEVLKLAQALYEADYIKRLQNFTRSHAREYFKKHGTLTGFDPALLQNAFVPFQNFGRAGNDLAWELMRDMAEAIQDERCRSCGEKSGHLEWCPSAPEEESAA